jgi:type III pantothenate kinase
VSDAGEHLLTVDLGNTRCKLRLWSPAGELARAADLDAPRTAAEEFALRCAAWLRAGPTPAAGAWCAVGAAELERALVERLGPLVAEGRLRAPDAGLELDVEAPHSLGRDRIFAARGAFAHGGTGALIVDAGTALTVDALDLRGGRARFRGGAISAGPALLARALAEHAARLPHVEPRSGVAALGRDTRAALEAGVAVGFRGAARALVEGLALECGLERAPVYLTGGARAFLLEPRPFVERELVVVPDLVHLGLLAALVAERARAGAPG